MERRASFNGFLMGGNVAAKRRRQIAAGRITAANGLVS
jgi:hypothetical protein